MSNKETKSKVANAFRAMKALGITEAKVKPVLKNLLKLYDKKWELIEEENYRALADAIFEREESEEQERAKKNASTEAAEQSKKIVNTQTEDHLGEETQAAEEPERPLKRLRLRHRDGQTSSLNTSDNVTTRTLLVQPKEEPDEPIVAPINGPIGITKLPPPMEENTTIQSQGVSSPSLGRDKGKQPVSAEPLVINERSDPSQPSSMIRNQQKRRLETEPRSPSHPMKLRDRRLWAVSPQITSKEKRPGPDSSVRPVCLKEPKVEPDILSSPDKSTSNCALIKPKDEPFTDDMPCLEAPMVCQTDTAKRGDSSSKLVLRENSPEPSALQGLSEKETTDGIVTLNQPTNNSELSMTLVERPSIVEITSSAKGEVRICLDSNLAAGSSEFHMPSVVAVLKCVEDKCFRSPKPSDPNISLMDVMKEICQSFLELGTNSGSQPARPVDGNPTPDSSYKCSALASEGASGLCMNSLNSQADSQSGAKLSELEAPLPPPCNGMDDGAQSNMNEADEIVTTMENKDNCDQETNDLSLEAVQPPPATPCNNMDDGAQQNAGDEMATDGENHENFVQETNGQSLEVVQQHLPTPAIMPLHNAVDIAKGQERVVITLVNEVNDESPPSFHYIPQNAPFQNAYVTFSLARIGDKNCCATCPMDCLSSSTACACARETGGEFAYTSDELVKEELLKECISMNRDPKKHSQYFCKECPLERSKSADIVEPCKGHLVRKFIKECWWKCGCNMQCGNRVVQRGISHNLQVFMTPEGKGWGLRTLEDLPKGAFVCEYVGEVLTNAELFDRVLKSPEGEKHSYPVLLDADWCAEAVLKDEEALCLDATYYGNVARFINHRCYDSNLVEIPVEVETPDHHYYHLAFFTTRKVKAMEELTWDYGIDFDDHEHPIKAFRCQCGSKFCRNIKRSRSRSSRR